MNLKKLSVSAGALMLAASFPVAANAAVVVNLTQSGADVVVDVSGSLNLSGLTLASNFIALSKTVRANGAYVGVGTASAVMGYSGLTGPATFGPGGSIAATSNTGIGFAINGGAFANPVVFVPIGYESGTAISAGGVFAGRTFASLGLVEGQYVFQAPNDTVTVNIGSAVPEPATWAMMMLGFGGVGYAMRRKSKVTTRIRFA